MGSSRRAERPIKRWYWIALGLVLGIGYLVMVVVAITNPTTEVWIGLATVTIPVVLAIIDAVVRALRRRRQ